MWRWRHRTRLALAVIAGAILVIGVGRSPVQPVEAATPTFPVAPNGEYLIQFQPGVAQSTLAARRLTDVGIVLEEVARNVPISLATLTPAQAAQVASSTGVVAIWPNFERRAQGIAPDPPWGLDRTDQTDLPLDHTYSYSSRAGAGTTIYIIDSGINANHVEFTGRIAPGVSKVLDDPRTDDCAGHGTHVAGIAAGTRYGVAKLATIVPVRVLDCNGDGTDAGVIAGIQWVIDQHTSGRAVANLSLGGPASPILDDAIERLVADGVAVAVAAGNAADNACNYSPARAPSALTVGASDISDARSWFSNYGSCVDLFAPGSAILSAWIDSPDATGTRTQVESGTSMASPHVAGGLALLWTDHPNLSAVQVQQMLLDTSTRNRLINVGSGSPNLLLHLAPPYLAKPATATQPARRCGLRC